MERADSHRLSSDLPTYTVAPTYAHRMHTQKNVYINVTTKKPTHVESPFSLSVLREAKGRAGTARAHYLFEFEFRLLYAVLNNLIFIGNHQKTTFKKSIAPGLILQSSSGDFLAPSDDKHCLLQWEKNGKNKTPNQKQINPSNPWINRDTDFLLFACLSQERCPSDD